MELHPGWSPREEGLAAQVREPKASHPLPSDLGSTGQQKHRYKTTLAAVGSTPMTLLPEGTKICKQEHPVYRGELAANPFH